MPSLSRTFLILTASFLFFVLCAHADTILPGTTIDQHNWQAAEQVIPPEILRLLQAGDFAITVQKTTDFPVRQAYRAATETNTSQFIATRPTFKDDDSPRRYEMMELLRRGK